MSQRERKESNEPNDIDPSLGFTKASNGTRFRVQRRETDHRSNGTKYPRSGQESETSVASFRPAKNSLYRRNSNEMNSTGTGFIRVTTENNRGYITMIFSRVHHQFVRARTNRVTINFIYRKSVECP